VACCAYFFYSLDPPSGLHSFPTRRSSDLARLVGASPTTVLLRHVLPNALRPVLSLAILQFGIAILVIAGLAFLGYGDPPPASDWGLLVSDGREHLLHAPWLVIAPGVVIAVVVLSVSRLSSWLDQGRNR